MSWYGLRWAPISPDMSPQSSSWPWLLRALHSRSALAKIPIDCTLLNSETKASNINSGLRLIKRVKDFQKENWYGWQHRLSEKIIYHKAGLDSCLLKSPEGETDECFITNWQQRFGSPCNATGFQYARAGKRLFRMQWAPENLLHWSAMLIEIL